MRLTGHPLMRDLIELKGNPRACVYTEPLWGIPYNLYIPFAAVYMQALGLSDARIGILLSVGLFFQVFASLFGGVVTDKMGRRMATIVFDLISWSLPCLIWAFAQNVWWFAAAASLNSLWQVTCNSWNSLLVEEADQQKLVSMYTWVSISGLLAVFFAPLSSLLVARMGVVPAMRVLYMISFVMMTAKFVILYFCSTETPRGRLRMAQTRGVSVVAMFGGYKDVLAHILRSRPIMITLGILIVLQITSMVTDTFFAIYATRNLGVPEAMLAYFPMLRAGIMLAVMFLVQHRIRSLKAPMIVGIALFVLAQIVLIFSPVRGYPALMIYVGLSAFGHALLMPRKDALLAIVADHEERSRVVAAITVLIIAATTPFGTIAGWLSEVSRVLPFVLNIALFLACGALVAVVPNEGGEGRTPT